MVSSKKPVEKKKILVKIKPEDVITYCFQDLQDYPNDLRDFFFYGREMQESAFVRNIVESSKEGTNIVIVGDSGVGKTAFLQKVYDKLLYGKYKDELQNLNVIPLLIDCIHLRKSGDKMIDFKQSFIKEYINKVDSIYPCNALKLDRSIDNKYSELVQHILDLDKALLLKSA